MFQVFGDTPHILNFLIKPNYRNRLRARLNEAKDLIRICRQSRIWILFSRQQHSPLSPQRQNFSVAFSSQRKILMKDETAQDRDD